MTSFTIFPAIDLRAGKVVRLSQGDPGRQTVYADDPGETARRWLDAGAGWLHVVNLDGAFGEGGEANPKALRRILDIAGQNDPEVSVQFGGGLRSDGEVQQALETGVRRAVLGSLAAEQPEQMEALLARFGPERLALGMDIKDGRVRVRGWAAGAGIDPLELGRRFARSGGRTCIYTEINRDGLRQGLDLDSTLGFARATGLEVVASGGAASMDDVRRARPAGLAGVILGRALYENVIDLRAAVQEINAWR